MQISALTQQKWFWPVVVIGGLLLVMTLSNRPNFTPEGLPIVETDAQYNDAIKKAHELTKPIFDKADAGEELNDEEKKQLVEGATYIDAANHFAPTRAIPFLGAGKAYLLADVLDLAEPRLRQCVSNSQLVNSSTEDKLAGYEALYRLSRLHFNLGNFDAALEYANGAVKAEPNGVNYLSARASALIQLHRLDEADKDIHAVLLLAPDHREAKALHQLLATEDPKLFGPKHH